MKDISDNIVESKLIIISRTKPSGLPYYRGRVEEIRLSGFSLDEVGEMFEAENLEYSERELTELYILSRREYPYLLNYIVM